MGVVVQIDDARDPAESLKPILDLVREDMGGVNRIILDKAVSDVELIPKLAHHLIDSGGKRLRPMLTSGGEARSVWRRGACEARGGRRVHAHCDIAS